MSGTGTLSQFTKLYMSGSASLLSLAVFSVSHASLFLEVMELMGPNVSFVLHIALVLRSINVPTAI